MICFLGKSQFSNHGQRVPNACPPGVTRKVLNLYYYSTHRDDEDANVDPHFTSYKYKTEASPWSVQVGAEYRAAAGTDVSSVYRAGGAAASRVTWTPSIRNPLGISARRAPRRWLSG